MLNPTVKKAYQTAEALTKDRGNWQHNLLNYLNENGYRLSEIAHMIKPGTNTRSMLDKFAPEGFATKAESVLRDLINKQEGTPGKPERQTGTKGSKSTRAGYRILPLNK